MRQVLIAMTALKFGTVSGAFGIAHVDPENEEAAEVEVSEAAARKLEAKGFAERSDGTTFAELDGLEEPEGDDDDVAEDAAERKSTGNAAAARVKAGTKAAAKGKGKPKAVAAGKKPTAAQKKAAEAATAADLAKGGNSGDTRDTTAFEKPPLTNTNPAEGSGEGEGGEGDDDAGPA